MITMRPGALLLILSCSNPTWVWARGSPTMADVMRFQGGKKVPTECDEPGTLHSSFRTDAKPLVDEVEAYMKEQCRSHDKEESQID